MDYERLAERFMGYMHHMRRSHPHRAISRAVQGERQVLQCILEEGGGIRPSLISERMGISTARIAATLNALEQKGWVTRRIDPGDRRRILVDLTPEGRQHAKEAHREVLKEVAAMLERLGEHDAMEHVRIVGKLVQQKKEGGQGCKGLKHDRGMTEDQA